MKKLLPLFICIACLLSCSDSPKTEEKAEAKTGSDAAPTVLKDFEFADARYVDIAKKHMAYLETGDIDSWMTGFADNAVYRWNNFDSLIGKAAITEYWEKRRTDVIDSMLFTDDIWLPIKVNKAQAASQLTGNYALSWYVVTAKYKTGKSMKQRIHTAFHFDENDKIDRVSQYLDRVPINAAMAK